jgi:hypothetical protein
LNGIRAAKYAVRAASLVLELLILLIIAGPVVGAVSPLLGPQQQPLGVGVDLNSINSQLTFFNSGSTIIGNHSIVVPAFNRWPLPASASLFLTLIVNGQTIYQTQPDAVQLGPFQSGSLHFTMDLTSSLVTKLQGQKVGIGGTMSISEGQFFAITVTFPQG